MISIRIVDNAVLYKKWYWTLDSTWVFVFEVRLFNVLYKPTYNKPVPLDLHLRISSTKNTV